MRVVTANGTVELGTLQASPTIGITDYSRRVTDDFGITTVVPRGFAHRMSVTLGLPIDQVDGVQQALAELRTTKAQWIADDRFGSLSFAGFYKDFELTLATALSLCTLTVEGTATTDGFVDAGGDPAPEGARSTLLLLDPVTIGDATLTASSVAEADAPVWNTAATYAKGARVLRGAAHRIYESVIDGNVGHDPASAGGQWLDVGPTGRWAMFDQALGSSTSAAEPIMVTLKVAAATTALAALDTNAATVRVQAPGYDRTIAPTVAGKALFLDLDVAAGASLTITLIPATSSPQPRRWDDGAAWMDEGVWRDSLAAGDGTVTIGTLLVGALRPIGITEDRPTASIIDYSRKVTDDFGEVTVVPRSWAKKMAAAALLSTDAVDLVAGRLTSVRARPALWIGQEGLDSLIVYGFVKDWEITVDPGVSKLSLSIEGLSTAGKVEPFNPGGTIAWPDITDPNGTKPTDNADKTSENTSKDTNAVGGVPAASITGRLTTLVEVTIPAVEAAGAAAAQRITEARAAADLALSTIENEVERVDQRIDTLSANGGYDDTAVKAEIKRVDEVSLGRDAALGTRIDSVSASVTDTDTNLRALVQTKETAAVSRENAISQRVDQLIAEGGGGSEGVDTIARSEIQRVEQAAVLGQQALTGRMTLVEASSRSVPTMLNGNAAFSDWPDAQYLPSLFQSGDGNTGNNVFRVPGKVGRWAMRQIYSSGYGARDTFLTIGSLQFYGGQVDARMAIGPGYFVLEADVELEDGQLVGSGLQLAGFSASGVPLQDRIIDFAGDPDGTDTAPGPGVPGRRYRFTKLVRLTHGDIRHLRVQPLLAFTALDRGYSPYKTLVWHFVGVRQADEAEIKADRAVSTLIPAVTARIKTTEDTLADLPNRYATAQRATNIEAAVGAVGGRLSNVETVTSNGTFATSARAEQIASYAGDVNARVDLQAGTIAALNGKAAAYVRIIADAGNGRAALSLWSDQYGGAWQLSGNGLIDGNLTINGTLNVRAVNGATWSRYGQSTWSGSMTPGAGSRVLVPWSISLPTIPPQGRFIYEFRAVVTSNVGQRQTQTRNGRPYYIDYVDAGGGLEVLCLDPQGNGYRPRANGSDPVLATADFAPLFQASIGNGNYDTGIIDEGDYYSRQVAATFTLSLIDLRLTWIAV